jgi:hypothetical protein
MSPEVRGKIDTFLQDERLQEKFEKILLGLDLSDIIWPENHPKAFGKSFVVTKNGRSVVYPLANDELKIHFLEYRVHALIRNEGGRGFHPSIAYYHLTLYEEALLRREARRGHAVTVAPSRISFIRGVEIQADGADLRGIAQRVLNLRKKLSVPSAVKKALGDKELLRTVLIDANGMYEGWLQAKHQIENAEVELEMYRNPDYIHSEHRRAIDQALEEKESLKERLHRESSRADLLEKEVSRLAEQIISREEFVGHKPNEELENLRREHNLLSQKYDGLVTRNIELSNRLERASSAKSLESILDLIRDRINASLRAGVAGHREGDEALLRGLKEEIIQMQRARIYMGRVLFDIGLLYLRLGQKERAVAELKAARELGIEDPETNRIINTPR